MYKSSTPQQKMHEQKRKNMQKGGRLNFESLHSCVSQNNLSQDSVLNLQAAISYHNVSGGSFQCLDLSMASLHGPLMGFSCAHVNNPWSFASQGRMELVEWIALVLPRYHSPLLRRRTQFKEKNEAKHQTWAIK